MRAVDIVKLRPLINANIECHSKLEVFQNNTLRPLLKLQNDISLTLLNGQVHYKKLNFKNKNIEERTQIILRYLNSDKIFRSLFIGSILGLMTVEELEFYFENKHELNKRMINMQCERFLDNIFKKSVL